MGARLMGQEFGRARLVAVPTRGMWAPVLACLVVCACEGAARNPSSKNGAGESSTVRENPGSRYADVAERAARAEASAAGVALHRQAAELSLQQWAAEHDQASLERARGHLQVAARRRTLSGACQAALALARLEAQHAEHLEQAYLQAYRVVARFGRDGRHEDCVQDARFMLGVLDGHRPPSAQLAPIDADPDAGDPSVVTPVHDATAAAAAATAQLQTMDVYTGSAARGARSARVVLRFDQPPVFRRGERPAEDGQPRRVVFDFEGVRIAQPESFTRRLRGRALRAVDLQLHAEDAQLSFEVAEDATYRLFTLSQPPRLVLDVHSPRAADPLANQAGPLVVLDPGHGGEDHGAMGAHGRSEAELVLDISRRVRAWLSRVAPRVRVRLTRESDVLLSLEERAAMANVLEADLFVSVHLNASSEPVEHGGVASFVLDVNNDRNVLRLAARENQTKTSAVSELQFLVGSLARAEQARESREAARLIQSGTLFGGRRFKPHLHDRGVRSAMFYVLVGAQMPAVLVEASFLTQPDEAQLLAQGGYRDALAEGIARGIAHYLQGARTGR